MEDVKKLGRLEFVYDEHAAAAKMERELKTIEKHSNKYKYQREQEKKHAALQKKIQTKITSFIRNSNSLSQLDFEFLLDSIQIARDARIALMYSAAYRFYLVGKNR